MDCDFFNTANCCNEDLDKFIRRADQIGLVGSRGATGATGATGETGAVGPTGPQGEIGLQGVPGERGEKGEKGDSGISVEPSYANFLNTSTQSIQFATMQQGFLSFNATQTAFEISLENNGTEIVVGKPGIYKIDISLAVNNFYNSSNLMLYVNNTPVSNLVSSFTNSNYATTRIIDLNENDVVKIGATITRLVLNPGLSLSIVRIDE